MTTYTRSDMMIRKVRLGEFRINFSYTITAIVGSNVIFASASTHAPVIVRAVEFRPFWYSFLAIGHMIPERLYRYFKPTRKEIKALTDEAMAWGDIDRECGFMPDELLTDSLNISLGTTT